MKKWSGVGLAALIALTAAAPTEASTLGATNQGTSTCSANTVWFGIGAVYAAPSAGVLTSMATNTDSTTGHVALKAIRLGPAGVLVVGTTPQREITAAGPITFSNLHIPVSEGDGIGTWSPEGYHCYLSSITGYGYGGPFATDPQPGAKAPLLFAASSGLEVEVSATFEPDADHDRFGDLSQDACPGDPALHTPPCRADLALSVQVIPKKIPIGGVSAIIAKVTNKGRGSGLSPVLSVNPGDGLKMIGTGPACNFTTVFNCPLANLSPGSGRSSVFAVTGTSRGKHSVLVNVSGKSADPVHKNNTVRKTIKVTG